MEITLPASEFAPHPPRALRGSLLLSRYLPYLIATVPLLVLVYVVARYAVDVPYLDQWDIAPLFDKMYRGDLSLRDVWVQFNEHRCFFPEVLMLGLARLTHWNIRCECALSSVLTVGIFLILLWQTRRTSRALGLGQLRWAVPACALVVFSISQFENFLWGWQVTLMLGLLTGLGAILLLANKPFSWSKFSGSIGLGFVSLFSFANGALVWPIGLVLLCVVPPSGKIRRRAIAVWLLAAVFSFCLYLLDYQYPKGPGLVTTILHQPLTYITYVLKFIGSTCAQYGEGGILRDKTWALILGFCGLAVLSWAGWNIIRQTRSRLSLLAPYFALIAYSLGTAVMAASARATLGPGQPMCSRYCSLTGPLWFSMIIFLMLLVRRNFVATNFAAGGPVPEVHVSRARIARWLLFGVIAFLSFSSMFAVRSAKEDSVNRTHGRSAVLALKTNPAPDGNHDELFGLSPSPRMAADRASILMQHHLSCFRE